MVGACTPTRRRCDDGCAASRVGPSTPLPVVSISERAAAPARSRLRSGERRVPSRLERACDRYLCRARSCLPDDTTRRNRPASVGSPGTRAAAAGTHCLSAGRYTIRRRSPRVRACSRRLLNTVVRVGVNAVPGSGLSTLAYRSPVAGRTVYRIPAPGGRPSPPTAHPGPERPALGIGRFLECVDLACSSVSSDSSPLERVLGQCGRLRDVVQEGGDAALPFERGTGLPIPEYATLETEGALDSWD